MQSSLHANSVDANENYPNILNELSWVNTLFLLNVPVNNFSVIMGRSHHSTGINQYLRELKVSCSRTLQGGLDKLRIRLYGVITMDLRSW